MSHPLLARGVTCRCVDSVASCLRDLHNAVRAKAVFGANFKEPEKFASPHFLAVGEFCLEMVYCHVRLGGCFLQIHPRSVDPGVTPISSNEMSSNPLPGEPARRSCRNAETAGPLPQRTGSDRGNHELHELHESVTTANGGLAGRSRTIAGRSRFVTTADGG